MHLLLRYLKNIFLLLSLLGLLMIPEPIFATSVGELEYDYTKSGRLEHVKATTGDEVNYQYDNNGNVVGKQSQLSSQQEMYFDGTIHVPINGLDVNTDEGGENTVEFWMYWDGTNNVMPFEF